MTQPQPFRVEKPFVQLPRRMSKDAKQVFARQRCIDCPHLEIMSLHYSKFYVCVRSDQEMGQYDYCLLGFKR